MKIELTTLICIVLSPILVAQTGKSHEPTYGLVGWSDGQSQDMLPLQQTDMDLQVTGQILYAKIRQVYLNDTSSPLEVRYTFPLPVDATVTGMEFRTGNRIIRSVVQEREQAQTTYTTAKNQGKKAALLEQERPNLFTTSLANILPGEQIDIRFQYLYQMPFAHGAYDLTIPTTFGPRFLPSDHMQHMSTTEESEPLAAFGGGVSQNENNRLTPPQIEGSDGHQFTLSAHVQGLPIQNIVSNTHAIDVVESEEAEFEVTLSEGKEIPNRDVNIKIELWEAEKPEIGLVVSHSRLGTHGLLTVFPPLDGQFFQNPLPKEVIFLIDTSGSMSGSSIAQAKSGLIECLTYLEPEDRFNIIRFSNDYSSFSTDFVPADTDRFVAAERYVQNLEADGGTSMYPALEYALDLSHEPGFLKMIFFLTDGDVGNEHAMFSLLTEKGGNTRLFCFGVGTAPNAFLVKKLSETGRGLANFIRHDEDIGEVMAHFFETISTPILTDVDIAWRDRYGKSIDHVKQKPQKAPDVFLGRPLQLVCQFPDLFDGSVEVTGWINGQHRSFYYEMDDVNQFQFPGVEHLFGRATVADLSAQMLRAFDSEEREILKQTIIDTALDFQLVTSFTSRVAVEERIQKNPFGELVSVQVPVARKAEVMSFSATATSDPLKFAVGLFLLGLTAFLEIFRRRV